MSYRVIFGHPALKRGFEKVFLKTPSELQTEIMIRLRALGDNPRPPGAIKLKPPLDIQNTLAQYRIRVGNFRVFYDIDDQAKTVRVIALRRRNESTYL